MAQCCGSCFIEAAPTDLNRCLEPGWCDGGLPGAVEAADDLGDDFTMAMGGTGFKGLSGDATGGADSSLTGHALFINRDPSSVINVDDGIGKIQSVDHAARRLSRNKRFKFAKYCSIRKDHAGSVILWFSTSERHIRQYVDLGRSQNLQYDSGEDRIEIRKQARSGARQHDIGTCLGVTHGDAYGDGS